MCDEDESPCSVCGNEQRHPRTGLLTCECPAPIFPPGEPPAAAQPATPFTDDEINDVLTAVYEDGRVDLVLADRIAALLRLHPPASAVSPTQSWAVTVERNGEQVVTIASNCLAGRDLSSEDEQTIRDCAEHLRSFVGSDISLNTQQSPLSRGGVVELARAFIKWFAHFHATAETHELLRGVQAVLLGAAMKSSAVSPREEPTGPIAICENCLRQTARAIGVCAVCRGDVRCHIIQPPASVPLSPEGQENKHDKQRMVGGPTTSSRNVVDSGRAGAPQTIEAASNVAAGNVPAHRADSSLDSVDAPLSLSPTQAPLKELDPTWLRGGDTLDEACRQLQGGIRSLFAQQERMRPAKFRTELHALLRATLSALSPHSERAIRLAKEAVNGWACYAKKNVEHDEIARLHSEIANIERTAI